MKNLHFSVDIQAPKEKVWKVLWDDAGYRAWTHVFCEGSHVVTNWKEGSKALFLSGTGAGMYSSITKIIQNELMWFTHLGEVKDGKEEPISEETKKWSGAKEIYTLKETNGTTLLTVEVDITEDHESYFLETFPKALMLVKELSEG